jgi:hypothetical protein
MIYLDVNFTYPPELGVPSFSNCFKNQLTEFNVTWLRLTPVLA